MHINRTLIPYLEENKMKINPGKTESLLLIKRNTMKIYNKIKVGNNTIEIKKKIKYLGFVLDKGLTIQRHIEDRVSKARGHGAPCTRWFIDGVI